MNAINKVVPRLGDGEVLPREPVYWMIWVLDAHGKPYHSRISIKTDTPANASRTAYGIEPTERMIFFNMTSSAKEMRKKTLKLANLWAEMGGGR